MFKSKILISGLVFALLLSITGCSSGKKGDPPGDPPGDSPKKHVTIGFSDFSYGNLYYKQEEASFKKTADSLKKSGTVSAYYMVKSTKNTTQQISQINSLISKHVSSIIIDPSSSTALNSVISKAKKAGIPVVIVHNSPVTSKDAYQIVDDTKGISSIKATYIADRLKGTGNVVIMRGIAGTGSDANMYLGMMDVFNKYPNIKIVDTVYADRSSKTAQKQIAAILPKLPRVDAIIGESGDDDIGAIRAFQAAHRVVPLVTGENQGDFLNWWEKQTKANGYQTISSSKNPWSAAAGLYVVTDILNGKTVPKTMVIPAFVITQKDLSKYYKTASTAIASPAYDHNWVINNLENQKV
jgi:ribose transport system substrate-binding protein